MSVSYVGSMGMILNVMIGSTLIQYSQSAGDFRVVPTMQLQLPHTRERAFISIGCGTAQWISMRSAHRRCTCPMTLGCNDPRIHMNHAGLRSRNVDNFRLGSIDSDVRFSTSKPGMRRGTRRVSTIALNALKVGGDETGVCEDGKLNAEHKSGSAGSKGWEYWGYRALLVGVAAIWGTNFPVVSYT